MTFKCLLHTLNIWIVTTDHKASVHLRWSLASHSIRHPAPTHVQSAMVDPTNQLSLLVGRQCSTAARGGHPTRLVYSNSNYTGQQLSSGHLIIIPIILNKSSRNRDIWEGPRPLCKCRFMIRAVPFSWVLCLLCTINWPV